MDGVEQALNFAWVLLQKKNGRPIRSTHRAIDSSAPQHGSKCSDLSTTSQPEPSGLERAQTYNAVPLRKASFSATDGGLRPAK